MGGGRGLVWPSIVISLCLSLSLPLSFAFLFVCLYVCACRWMCGDDWNCDKFYITIPSNLIPKINLKYPSYRSIKSEITKHRPEDNSNYSTLYAEPQKVTNFLLGKILNLLKTCPKNLNFFTDRHHASTCYNVSLHLGPGTKDIRGWSKCFKLYVLFVTLFSGVVEIIERRGGGPLTTLFFIAIWAHGYVATNLGPPSDD